jgi:spore germination cell wall hydrolase CwlJ-like protein
MNDSLRILLVRIFASVFLCFSFGIAHADDLDSTTLPDVQLAELPPVDLSSLVVDIPTIVVEEETPIEKIHNETIEFIETLQQELTRTSRGFSVAWYTVNTQLDTEIKCMAQNIYNEARGEPMAGQLAVALVTINRVKSLNFPHSVCEVVFQKTRDIKTGKWIAQFSWTRHYSTKKHHAPHDLERWEQAMTIASYVLRGGRLDNIGDITQGSMYYHAAYIHPKTWKKYYVRTTKIGNHIFYKSKKAELEEQQDLLLLADPVVLAVNNVV